MIMIFVDEGPVFPATTPLLMTRLRLYCIYNNNNYFLLYFCAYYYYFCSCP